MTDPFVEPFRGMFALDKVTADQGSVFDVAALVALVGWTLIETLILAAAAHLRRETVTADAMTLPTGSARRRGAARLPAFSSRARTSRGARLMNLPAPLRPVNLPFRTMTVPRLSTMSLPPWTRPALVARVVDVHVVGRWPRSCACGAGS